MRCRVLLLALLFPGAANALPITYLEALSGDLTANEIEGPIKVFTLGAGLNTIWGEWGSDTGLPPCTIAGRCLPDFDSFAIVVPESHLLRSVTLAFLPDQFTDWSTSFRIGSTFEDVSPTGGLLVDMFSAILPLRAGSYQVDHASFSADTPGALSRYVWGFVVTVPEPSTTGLMLFGLGLLVVRRWASPPIPRGR